MKRVAFLILVFFFWVQSILAQDAQVLFEEGIALYNQQQFTEATEIFLALSKKKPRHATYHYWLAKTFWEQPKRNAWRSHLALQEALKLEPLNLEFLQLRLQHVRSGDSFFGAKVSALTALEKVGEKLLEQDTTNTIALEALGILAYQNYKPYSHLKEKNQVITDLALQAISYLEKAKYYQSTEIEAGETLAFLYMQQPGFMEKLTMQLEELRIKNPQGKEKYALMEGIGWYRNGMLEIAYDYFQLLYETWDATTRKWYDDLSIFGKEAISAEDRAWFWKHEDTNLLSELNERELEHFVRVSYVRLFDWMGTKRGEVLIRYGFPGIDTTTEESFDISYESESGIFEVWEGDGFMGMNLWDYGDIRFGFLTHAFQEPTNGFYSPPAIAFSLGSTSAMTLLDYTIQGENTFNEIPQRSQFRFKKKVDFPFLVTQFRGETGKTDVYVHKGIPIENLDSLSLRLAHGSFIISETEKQILGNTEKTVLSDMQTLTHYKKASLWIDTDSFSLPNGAFELRVIFQDSLGMVGGNQITNLSTKNWDSSKLAMSDLMLASLVDESVDSRAGIQRNGFNIQPVPWGVFATEQPIYIYFEVYHLALSQGEITYQIEAKLKPKTRKRNLIQRLFQRGNTGVSVQYTTVASTSDDYQYVILDTLQQPVGLYELEVSISTMDGKESVKSVREIYLE